MTRSFILTLGLLILTTFSALAQKNYEKEWLAIEQLEIDGNVKSALEKVNTLSKKAKGQKNNTQYLKTLLFRWKFQQIIDEKSQVTILEELEAEIKKQEFPTKQLLHMYMAHFLETYLNDNFWNISRRTTTEKAEVKNYQTWDQNTFINQISSHYNKALTPYLALAEIPTEKIAKLLVTVPISRKYKPTVYDIIAHKALDFYKNSRNRVNKPKDEFLIDNEQYFETTSSFKQQKISTTDPESLIYKGIKIYQQLETIHSQRKNEIAWATNVLKRLQFVKENYTGTQKEELYLQSLQKLVSVFEDKNAIAKIEVETAHAYRTLAFHKDEDGKFKFPDYNIKAIELLNNIEKQKLDIATIIEAKNLKSQILQQKITWLTQDKYLPNQPHLAKITFTNTKNITINAYKIPHDFDQNQWNYNERDSLIKDFLSKQKIALSKKYTLPKKTDYNTYSTEVIVPELSLGTYLFQIQTGDIEESFKYHKVVVTELSLNKTEQKNKFLYQVLNRYTGAPIANAKIIVEKNKGRNREAYSKNEYTTNDFGEFLLNKSNRYENNTIVVKVDDDIISINENNYGRSDNYNYLKELNKYRSKIMVFLDRGIYRPKQTVYFKAIAISEENQKSAVLAETPIEILVSNRNGEKVYSTTLTTNEYGSVKGEFKLPDGGLNGNYNIRANFKKPKSRNDQSGYQSFSVEEYKRPTFEVSFLPAKEIYKPLDSITVKGNAKAFLGSMVTDADVEYSVKRTVQYRHYWWRSSFRNNEAKQITTGIVTTNDKGEFEITFKAVTDEANTKDKIYNYKVEAKVTDLNGETREQTTNIRVADKNLIANINTADTWNSEENTDLKVAIEDVNNNPIKANGKVTIYKLQSPGRFLNDRPWPIPDIQNISEADFKKQFPNMPFSNEKEPKNWKIGKVYCEHEFTNTEISKISCEDMKSWPVGKYLIVSTVTDPITKATTETKKAITLNHPKQKIPADEQLFVSNVDYEVTNPTKATIKLQTAVPELTVFAEYFDGNKSFRKEKILLKKGSKRYTLDIPKLTFPKVSVVLKYQIFNTFYTKTETLDFSEKPIQIAIEKKHFTDKLVPGGKETWSFLLKKSDKSAFNAEALASMYDASLDQFRSSRWNTNFGFGKGYPRPNRPRSLFSLGTKSVNFYGTTINLPTKRYPLERINNFGFHFNFIHSGLYNRYIFKLKSKVQKPLPSKGYTTIYGIVSDSRLPLPGVNIKNINTNSSVVSDFDGLFSIDVKLKDTLKVSYYGFKEKIVTIGKYNSMLDIILEEDTNALEEVVVIGYGFSRRRDVVGSVTSLKAEDIDKVQPVSFEQALVANAPGVSARSAKKASGDVSFNNAEFEDDESVERKGDSETAKDLKTIQTRKNFQETAFFLPNLRTNKKGEIEFEFESPEALTRWNFRMLAHTKEAVAGSFSAQTLTQKDLNIIPNAPRFVREGDHLRFTAKVANLTDKVLNGTALLEWTNPETGETVNQQLQHTNLTQNFSIGANGNSLLSWKIAIPEDLSAIQYKIVAKANNFTDGEEKAIPVLSNRMLVTESVPLWVRAGETETFELNNFEPNSKTQKPHNITLEYTSNPAWMAIKSLPYLMEFPHECAEQTFSRLYANAISAHILNSQPKIKAVFDSWAAKGTLESPLEKNEELKNILLAESPWLQEAKSETEQQKRLAELFDLAKTAKARKKAINKLRQLQKSNGGFPWFQGGRANSYITRHIVTGFGHLEKLGVTEERTKTNTIVKNAIRFLDKELIADLNDYLKHHKTAEGFYKQTRLLHYAYARSFFLQRFPLKGETKDIVTKALAFQKENWLKQSLYNKGLLALVLYRYEKSPVIQKILTSLIESSVNSKANGMYWKENTSSWWWYQNPIVTQALLIEAFAETEQPKKYIEEMKIYLLKNKRTNRWETTIETANASYALLAPSSSPKGGGKLDFLSVKDNTVIKVGGEKIATKKLSETEKEQGSGYFKTNWKADEITPKFKTITVKNNSKIVGYGGYYWQYFENLDNIKTDEKGPLTIDKELYKKVTTDKGTELKRITSETPLEIGDKVTVRLLVKSEDNLEFVHLKDMRASGFEPTKVLSGYEYKELWYYQSTKDVATHFFIDRLPKGNYVLEYDVIANQSGSFSNGITTLQCMYAPEFSGHSAGQRVEIK